MNPDNVNPVTDATKADSNSEGTSELTNENGEASPVLDTPAEAVAAETEAPTEPSAPTPVAPAPQDRSVQYLDPVAEGDDPSAGLILDIEADAKWRTSVPTAAWITVFSAIILSFVSLLGATLGRDILTMLALVTAAMVSLGLPRTVGAPAPRHSSAVALIFSLLSVLAVRVLDDLYIAAIICALSVVAAFIAEMLRKDGRPRLLDSVSTTVMTTVAATCSVAIVGLAPHGSWELALVGSSVCVAGAALSFQLMRMLWPGLGAVRSNLMTVERTHPSRTTRVWVAADSPEGALIQEINVYWMLNETARTITIILSGLLGALIAAALYSSNLITGRNADVLLRLGQIVGGGAIPLILVGLLAGMLSGFVVMLGIRILRPTTVRVPLWGAIAWGVLPTIVMAMPTYALVRMAGA
ncbi:hypothetical protein BK816_01490 [Boudabousia tangfeifanii]|uniref:Uncharacterized protein n=1 Tax=Boudabousia tangfeifanii TaxID=1912795 RepID=A0A1D9MIG8_9ACTO|nr:hypothetical protein [Boudabousia tangfeifanii]AOZ72131.1 hypothetical protein BK816_01490 [Boudabousia tangfeifanii]